MQVITVTIQKGGIGKTTTAAVLAQAAAYKGRRVLAVDFDPQGNMSLAVGAQRGTEANSYNLIMGEPAAEMIQTTPQGLDAIAASRALATLTTRKGSAYRLRRALEPIKGDYDFIFIDTPTAAGELQYNALMAATGLVIPLEADAYNMESIYQTLETAQQIQQANTDLQILGLVFTKHNDRTNLTRQVKESISAEAAEMGIPTLGAVRIGIAVREAAALRQSLYSYAPKSNPAQDYLKIYNAIAQEV